MSFSNLPLYKLNFLKAAIDGGALKFGSFELKSGRISPYFFNTGQFYQADLLRAISSAYAGAIIEAQSSSSPLKFDIVFGPAYKGIPLATSTVDKLADLDPERYGKIWYSFDRKEAKEHGEGGNIVGGPLKGKKVLIVDDVITDGAAKRHAIDTIRKEGGIVAGILVALDRMERLPAKAGDDMQSSLSAIEALRREYGIPVMSILTLDDMIQGLKGKIPEETIRSLQEYKTKYKASN